MIFKFTSPHISVMGEHGDWWHFLEDPITPERTAAEELFQLGFLRLESWKWHDKTVVKYRPTSAGKKELAAFRKNLSDWFERAIKAVDSAK